MIKHFVFFLVLTITLSSCTFEEPVVSDPYNFSITNVKSTSLEIGFDLNIQNPNDRSFKISNTDLEVHFNQVLIGETTLLKNVEVPGKFNGTKHFTMQLDSEEPFEKLILPLLVGGLTGNSKMKLEGEVAGKIGLLKKRFDVKHTAPLNLSDLR